MEIISKRGTEGLNESAEEAAVEVSERNGAQKAVLPLIKNRPTAGVTISDPYLSGGDVVLLEAFVVLIVAEDVDHLDDVLLVNVSKTRMADWFLADKRKMGGNLWFLL